MLDIYAWSNPKFTKRESIPIKYTFESGVTMLIGSNGTGKSTLLRQLSSIFGKGNWIVIEDNENIRNNYNCYYYDNEYEQNHRKQTWLEDTDSRVSRRIVETFENSEGQNMWDYLYYQLYNIGKAVRNAKEQNKKGIFLLFDGLDSGLSLDKIYKLKQELLDFIIKTDETNDFKIFIICSANSFELSKGYDCVDVKTQEHIKFNNYEEYEKYFMEG